MRESDVNAFSQSYVWIGCESNWMILSLRNPIGSNHRSINSKNSMLPFKGKAAIPHMREPTALTVNQCTGCFD